VLHVSYLTVEQLYYILNCGESTAECQEQLPLPSRQKQKEYFSVFTQSTAELTRHPDNSQTVHFHDLGPKFPKQKVVVQNSFQIMRQARKLTTE
jgi:hypothetical protein